MKDIKGISFKQFLLILTVFVFCNCTYSQNQLFGPRNKLTGGTISSTLGLFSDDLNNDGKIDIICSSRDEIVWYENLGENEFDFQETIKEPNYTGSSIAYTLSEDFNGDGNIDIAYLLRSELVWIENNGSGNFDSTHIISQSSFSTLDLVSADFNNNGTPDLLCASQYGGLILRKNNGIGEFDLPDTVYTIEQGIWKVNAGDIDFDNDIDLLVSFKSTIDQSRQLFWLENDSNGSFPVKHFLTDSDILTFQLCNLDNDDDLDILYVNRDNSTEVLTWFENDGAGSFAPKNPIDTINGFVHQVNSIDINNDGKIDVLASAAYTFGLFWYENLGSNTFSEKQIIDSLDGLLHFTFADLNSDEFIDIAAASSSQVLWYQNEQNNSFSNGKRLTSKTHGANYVTGADINNDGFHDIISKGYEVFLFKNSGNMQLEDPEIILDHPIEGVFLIADLDNDTDQDIVYDRNWYFHGFYWAENNGQGVFMSNHAIAGKGETYDICAADFDSDGDIDLSTMSWGAYNYHENTDHGIFTEPRQLSSASLGYSNKIFASDLNGDSHIDILISSNYDYSRIYYSKNEGNGQFESKVLIGYGISASSIYADDLNNDGHNEVIVAFKNELVYYPSLENGDFGEKVIISDDLNYYGSLHVEDIDMDGFKDIIYQASGMHWHQNLGTGKFGKKRLIDNSHIIRSIYTFDFDNDGDPDIFTAGNSSISWYENLLITTDQTENHEPSHSFDIYPNPATNSFTIQSSVFKYEGSTVEIIDMYGRIIQRIPLPKNQMNLTIDISHLQKGMYIIRITGSRQLNVNSRLIKN